MIILVKKRYYFYLLLIIYFAYSVVVILRSSFIMHGVRYFSLFDDEMISMRYAQNFARGYGLIWNPGGEKVQGFTNLLWTLYMAVIHLFPVPLPKMSLVIQLTGVLCIIVSLFFVKKIAELVSNNSHFVIFFSVLFSAFYFPLINWSVILGTEVSILTLLLTLVTYKSLVIAKTKKFSILLFLILGLGIIVRLDFLVPSMAIVLFLLFIDKTNRREYIFKGIPLLLLFIIGIFLFQFFYYHSILPNSYYLKLTGYPILNRITRGMYTTIKSVNVLLFLIPFIYLYVSKNIKVFLLLELYMAVILYNIYVGGDAWESYGGANRYVVIAMPLFFISIFMTLFSINKLIKHKYLYFYNKYRTIETFIIFIFFILINSGSDNMLSQLFLLGKPYYKTLVSEGQVELAYRLTKSTTPNAKIAIVLAGTAPYFTHRYFVDLLGKNESIIAREQARYETTYKSSLQKYISFIPGHMKWDYSYIITKYKPDLFAQTYGPDENIQYLSNDYIRVLTPEKDVFFIRKKTKNVIMTGLKIQTQ